ncbi:hypothetical protein E8E14_005437 [Neopestalotiopsis sp. 37M]|nr:hypothetical protein E8E14_005437 [Neopestalotiopsis sp. 37M]
MAASKASLPGTPDSSVSPRSQASPKQEGYFPAGQKQATSIAHDGSKLPMRTAHGARIVPVTAGEKFPDLLNKQTKDDEPANDSDASATTPGDTAPSPGSMSEPPSRKASISSVSFRQPSNPLLPQGVKKKPLDAIRRRAASPPHRR